jgi:hydroxyethylthiazole kinase-like uncharacterized protein yjeF
MSKQKTDLITKVFSAKQIKAADIYTITNEPIASIDLMERASQTCADWIQKKISKEKIIKIFCGHGNNGGDGLAISRLLLDKGYQVSCYLIQSLNYSQDCQENKLRLERIHPTHIHYCSTSETFPVINDADIIIDALFGTGLNKSPEGIYAELIQYINQSVAYVISIDMPSGLFCDITSKHSDLIVKASTTLSFQFPKLAFLFPENKKYVGEWEILDIHLHPNFISTQQTTTYILNSEYIQSILKPRDKFSHKGTFGHGLIIAGSKGKMGAAILASKSYLRSGAGLLTMLVPECGYDIIQTSTPEAMALTSGIDDINIKEINLSAYKSIALGPGIGTNESVGKSVNYILNHCSIPLVIDADALNCISIDNSQLNIIPKNSILTPHLKEFERLTEPVKSDFERHHLQIEFSIKHKVYVVLKGAHTCITTPEGEAYFNSTGNSGLAKGGSGDILTGLIAGLLAQNYAPKEAALIGVFLHGLAADITKQKSSETTMLPSDVIENYSKAIHQLSQT